MYLKYTPSVSFRNLSPQDVGSPRPLVSSSYSFTVHSGGATAACLTSGEESESAIGPGMAQVSATNFGPSAKNGGDALLGELPTFLGRASDRRGERPSNRLAWDLGLEIGSFKVGIFAAILPWREHIE